MNYVPIEISLIVANCASEEEVIDACRSFKYLISEVGQKHEDLIRSLTTRRIVTLNN